MARRRAFATAGAAGTAAAAAAAATALATEATAAAAAATDAGDAATAAAAATDAAADNRGSMHPLALMTMQQTPVQPFLQESQQFHDHEGRHHQCRAFDSHMLCTANVELNKNVPL